MKKGEGWWYPWLPAKRSNVVDSKTKKASLIQMDVTKEQGKGIETGR
uniref:Uncharacterized protein n=1 Tax=Medicago truncatula TaxID=3880 RepID=A2Q2Q7_MEDTR|nr:hypothetical protein MtrDRAFT_AC151524g40v2 [Medicago truncatula]